MYVPYCKCPDDISTVVVALTELLTYHPAPVAHGVSASKHSLHVHAKIDRAEAQDAEP